MSLAKDLDPLAAEPLWVTIPDEDNWWSDEPELETPLHLDQIVLLLTCLQWWWRGRDRIFISGNISIYYEKRQDGSRPNNKPSKNANRLNNNWQTWRANWRLIANNLETCAIGGMKRKSKGQRVLAIGSFQCIYSSDNV